MVRAIAQLARSMSIATVAEYVETEEIRARIATLGVDYGQGFAIGRPAPLADLLAELPLLVSASVVTRSLDTVGHPMNDIGDSGILNVEFVH
jgi:predicted signal transduction protein with EAL and GGDEF domain